ncbi:MAG: hypothetical protein ACXW31_06405 [Thermoanaerobaculia bacterium]
MTKAEARSWMTRWRAVEERERHELGLASYEERFRALAALMASRDLFDFSALDEEDAAVRARWTRLQNLAS